MSLQDLPALTFDVRERRTERRCVWVLVGLAVLATGLAMTRSVALGSFIVLSCVGPAAYLLRSGRWSGSRRLTRIAWLPDSRWRLMAEDATEVEATLRDDSRIIGGRCVWLRWNADIVRSMLLFRGDLTERDFRRLLVRLRIEGTRPGSDPTQAERPSVMQFLIDITERLHAPNFRRGGQSMGAAPRGRSEHALAPHRDAGQ